MTSSLFLEKFKKKIFEFLISQSTVAYVNVKIKAGLEILE